MAKDELDEFDFDENDFDLDFEIDVEEEFETRYIKPPKTKEIAETNLKYEDAKKLSKKMKNKELYKFNHNYQKRIIEKYKTINKSIRNRELWRTVNNKTPN